jgi:hypothetical protein
VSALDDLQAAGWKLRLMIVTPGPSEPGFTNEVHCARPACRRPLFVSDDVIAQAAEIICDPCFEEEDHDHDCD